MKVYTVKKARKAQGNCEVCHKPIEPGMGYRFIEPRYGAMKKRHLECAAFRASDMTSGKMSGVYAAQEGVEDFLAEWDGLDRADLVAALEQAADEIEAVADEYEESAQNIEDGFGHSTMQSEELAEAAREDWAEALRSAAEDAINDCPC